MLKPFYIKKKNIDNRLLPEVSVTDAGKVLGISEEGTIIPVEGGGGFKEISIDITSAQAEDLIGGETVFINRDYDGSALVITLRFPDGSEILCYLINRNSGYLSYLAQMRLTGSFEVNYIDGQFSVRYYAP